jgi:hypothetical protein
MVPIEELAERLEKLQKENASQARQTTIMEEYLEKQRAKDRELGALARGGGLVVFAFFR